MQQREYGFFDRIVGEIDKGIKVLSTTVRAVRTSPGTGGTALSADEARESLRLMRVNHAGEVAAQGLYQGQALTARQPRIAAAMRLAADEETDHLAWCEQRIAELGGRTSLLNPLWYAGSWCLGALAGACGDRLSLGFIAATEAQVESHLQSHLGRLPEADSVSRAIVEQMKIDEMEHGARAISLGGLALPAPLQAAMRLTSRLMTRSSYWL